MAALRAGQFEKKGFVFLVFLLPAIDATLKPAQIFIDHLDIQAQVLLHFPEIRQAYGHFLAEIQYGRPDLLLSLVLWGVFPFQQAAQGRDQRFQ